MQHYKIVLMGNSLKYKMYKFIYILFITMFGVKGIRYCKFGNFWRGLYFRETSHMRSFVKIKSSRNDKITLSFIGLGKPCLGLEFFTSLIGLLMPFAKIKFSRKFPNLQYCFVFAISSAANLGTRLNGGVSEIPWCPLKNTYIVGVNSIRWFLLKETNCLSYCGLCN